MNERFDSSSVRRNSPPRMPQRGRLGPVALMLALGMMYLWWTWNAQIVVSEQRFDHVMGTQTQIKIVAHRSLDAGKAVGAALGELERVEALASVYRANSFVSRLNDLPASTPLTVRPAERDVVEILALARRVSELSDGAYDVTFQSVGRFWNFDPEDPRLPTGAERAAAAGKIDWRNVVVDVPPPGPDGVSTPTVTLAEGGTKIGLGSVAKGWAVDEAVEALKKRGVLGALVNVGGDLYAYGSRNGRTGEEAEPWRIALRHPRDPSALLAEIPVRNVAVVTSGDYERSFVVDGVRYHHIIDPRTGMPTQGLISVTVLAESAAVADALSTAFFVMGWEEGFALADRLPGVEAVFIDAGGRIRATSEDLTKMLPGRLPEPEGE